MKITFRDQTWHLKGPLTVREAIEHIGLSPERLLTIRDGKVIREDDMLDEDDEIKLLAVIAGG